MRPCSVRTWPGSTDTSAPSISRTRGRSFFGTCRKSSKARRLSNFSSVFATGAAPRPDHAVSECTVPYVTRGHATPAAASQRRRGPRPIHDAEPHHDEQPARDACVQRMRGYRAVTADVDRSGGRERAGHVFCRPVEVGRQREADQDSGQAEGAEGKTGQAGLLDGQRGDRDGEGGGRQETETSERLWRFDPIVQHGPNPSQMPGAPLPLVNEGSGTNAR